MPMRRVIVARTAIAHLMESLAPSNSGLVWHTILIFASFIMFTFVKEDEN